MASLTDAEEAKRMSRMHQAWIIDTLEQHGGTCSYGELVEVGEEMQCDTVGSMIKYLKNKKVITFGPGYLMFPMHAAEDVTLVDKDILGDMSAALEQAKAQALGGAVTAAEDATPKTEGAAEAVEEVTQAMEEVAVATPDATGCFALEQLQTAPFPPGVDSSKREMYLEDEKFQELFGTDKDSFASRPGWKKTAAKKKHKLF